MTMEDLKPEKSVSNKQKNKKKVNSTNNTEENNSKAKPKKRPPRRKAKNTKENDNNTEITPAVDGSSDVFAYHEIADNKEASALIQDLVRCFTCNSNLPQKELDILNKRLYEKTVSVFLNILNYCVDKIFNKLLKTGLLNRKKIDKKDASCQTDDDSYGDL